MRKLDLTLLYYTVTCAILYLFTGRRHQKYIQRKAQPTAPVTTFSYILRYCNMLPLQTVAHYCTVLQHHTLSTANFSTWALIKLH